MVDPASAGGEGMGPQRLSSPPELLHNFAVLGGAGNCVAVLLHLALDEIKACHHQNIRGVEINPLPLDLVWTHPSQAACRLHVKPLEGFHGEGRDGSHLTAKQQHRRHNRLIEHSSHYG